MILPIVTVFIGVISLSTQFWIGLIVAIGLAAILFLTAKFRLRRFKFSDDDMKAAGLNHRQRRQLKARLKRKRRPKKIRF